jgi:hypothetical protein
MPKRLPKCCAATRSTRILGALGFDEKGDFTGIEMWSWYQGENGTVVKAPSELPPTE